MAEQEPTPRKAGGWLKAIFGTLGGMLSGAVVMYLTPLVDRAVAPAKPVANFRIEIDPGSLRVRFENLALGGQGWWEFGDGSPLEPILPNVEYVYHTYPQASEYTAKMLLHNILGEENDRTAPVRLETTPTVEPPHVLALDAEPISRGFFAPASFRLHGQVKGAQLLIWDLGDERSLESMDPTKTDRVVLFPRPGRYAVKLAAVNGSQLDQKITVINVAQAPSDTVTAVLTAVDQGSRMLTHTKPVAVNVAFPVEHADDILPVNRQTLARSGFVIKEVRVQGPSGREVVMSTDAALDVANLGIRNTRNLNLAFAPDRRGVHVTGDLVRPKTAGHNPELQPSLQLQMHVVEQCEQPADRVEVPITTTLAIPSQGVTSSGLVQLPPLAGDLVKATRKWRLELRDGDQLVWQAEPTLPYRVLLTLHNRPCLLTATQVNDQVHLDLRENVQGPPAPQSR